MKTVILLLALTLATVAQAYVPWADVLYGDANGDGVVTEADAQLVVDHVVKIDTIDAENLEAADVNLSGAITAFDATLIQKFLKGEIRLPYIETTSITTSVRAATWADVKKSAAR